MKITKQQLDSIIKEELEVVLDEKKKKKQQKGKKRARKTAKRDKKKKKAKKKDACYHKVRSRYDVWPSAYASGALVKCRKVGAKNWGKSTTKEELELYESKESLEAKIRDVLIKEGGAAGMKALKEQTEATEKEIKDAIKGMEDVGLHEDGDYILQDKIQIHVKKTIDEKKKKKKKAGTESGKEDDLGDWFGRKGEKGGKGGWVDCNAPDGDGGYKECAQGDRKKKPACRPTPGACKEKGKGKSWGKKAAKKESLEMNEELLSIIKEEFEKVYNTMIAESGMYYEVDAVDVNEEYCPVCVLAQMEEAKKKKKKKKACKPSKGKRFAKRVDGKCRSYGQAGKAKSGGDRIRPGTKKGDAYCARSAGIKKCKNPPCANTLSRKKWKCRGKKSMKS
jgi:hypothetical protein